jgi:N6-adenosine-specific RNA methylase IME4
MTWPFGGLTPYKYGALLVDPPWSYVMRSEAGYAKSPEAHYETMSIDRIKRLPVGDLAGPDCLIWLWSTWPHLPLALEVMSAWGYRYKTGGAWHKRTITGKTAMGTGYVLRSATEPYLIGTIGNPIYRSRSVRNVIATDVDESGLPSALDGLRREHSRKPPEARQAIEALLPDVWRAELFAREAWPGGDVWGNQTDHFEDNSNV